MLSALGSAIHILGIVGWPCLLAPPAVQDMFSVCLTQCIFNEPALSSVFHSMGLGDANKKTPRSHVVQAQSLIMLQEITGVSVMKTGRCNETWVMMKPNTSEGGGLH